MLSILHKEAQLQKSQSFYSLTLAAGLLEGVGGIWAVTWP